jgi:hypothetical protein
MAANAVQIPPIRTNLNDPNITDQTAKEWYLFWQRSGDRINVLNQMIGFGTHAGRPDPQTAPDGALYVENDRGNVIYQNIAGVWNYLAGTMWGTVSPDQRPTDLGVRDGGFDYRGTDEAREFIWSQTAWVEVTAVRYGTHSGRPPAAGVADGSVYVEWDRGGVIYQSQMSGGTPVWEYLAGTMYGTLVPDERPTDLGAKDVGFTFRTSVAPPREFIWSGGMWVEVTPQPQTPWTSDIDGAAYKLTNVSTLGIGTASPAQLLHIMGTLPILRLSTAAATEYYDIERDNSDGLLAFTGGQAPPYCGYKWLLNGVVEMRLNSSGGLALPNLPSSNPGAGSRLLWFDPADGYRVKFAP